MWTRISAIVLAAALAGCGQLRAPDRGASPDMTGKIAVQTPDGTTIRPLPRPGATPPPSAKVPGRTVLTLGNPALPGLWVETPLVRGERPGTVTVSSTGNSAAVTLRPGPAGGARASLQTMLALGLSPAALADVVVTPQ